MNLKNRFKPKNEKLHLMHTDSTLAESMNHKIISLLPESPREYIVLCIGTDRSTGDALGPLTGTYLMEKKPRHLAIYGTLSNPVHAINLGEYINLINAQHRKPYIIAVDASLGKISSVGSLILEEGPLKPGAAVNKSLPAIGDIHIIGVVNISGFLEYSILQNTRLSTVVEMAKSIACVLNTVDQRLQNIQTIPAIVSTRKRDKTAGI